MKQRPLNQAIALVLGTLGATTASATETEVTVTIEILSPDRGTAQSPHWVGFHDGTFDIYNPGELASSLPIPGSRAVEQLAEDGDNSGISADFGILQPQGVDASILGSIGDLVPGEIGTMTFTLDSTSEANRYFSYGSMVLPSNDFFYANADPQSHPIFDEDGNFIARDFIIGNRAVRDAGTELNDEIPENTAFFGQVVNDTGVPTNDIIRSFGDDSGLVAFTSVENGGLILADSDFSNADFTLDNYVFTMVRFSAVESTTFDDTPLGQRVFFSTDIKSGDTVPAPDVETTARGAASLVLQSDDSEIRFGASFLELKGVTAVDLRLGADGETGPVVASLLPDDFDVNDGEEQQSASEALKGSLVSSDLTGPLAGLSVSALARQILDGNIYLNVETELNPTGEIRGQLK